VDIVYEMDFLFAGNEHIQMEKPHENICPFVNKKYTN